MRARNSSPHSTQKLNLFSATATAHVRNTHKTNSDKTTPPSPWHARRCSSNRLTSSAPQAESWSRCRPDRFCSSLIDDGGDHRASNDNQPSAGPKPLAESCRSNGPVTSINTDVSIRMAGLEPRVLVPGPDMTNRSAKPVLAITPYSEYHCTNGRLCAGKFDRFYNKLKTT